MNWAYSRGLEDGHAMGPEPELGQPMTYSGTSPSCPMLRAS